MADLDISIVDSARVLDRPFVQVFPGLITVGTAGSAFGVTDGGNGTFTVELPAYTVGAF